VAQTVTSGLHATLVEFERSVWPQQWNKLGLLYAPINDLSAGDLYFRTNDGALSVIRATDVPEGQAHISPNGAWMAWTQTEAGGSQIYIEAFPPNGGRRLRVEVANGGRPTWSADGAALYVTSHDRLLRVPLTENDGLTLGEPSFIRELGTPYKPGVDPYDVSSDESRIIYVHTTYPEPPVVVRISNWSELLLD